MSYETIKDIKDIPRPLHCDTKHKIEWLEQQDLSQSMRTLYSGIQILRIGGVKYRLTTANFEVFVWEYQLSEIGGDLEIRFGNEELLNAYLLYLSTITIEKR